MDFRSRRIFFNIVGAFLAVALCVCSFFAIINVVFNVAYIKTNVYQFSMYPTLNANVKDIDERGDVVYINKYAPISRGDIVVANVMWNEKPIIKRLVACPGDSFRIEENSLGGFDLIVNEQLMYSVPKTISIGDGEPHKTENHYSAFLNYVENNRELKNRIVQNAQGKDEVKLFKNEYLLLGDNWADSRDGLTVLLEGYSFISRSEILGKVDMIIHKGENNYLSLFKQMMKIVFSF